jgi:hypothetical protein
LSIVQEPPTGDYALYGSGYGMYVTLVIGRDDFSEIIREIIEYSIKLVREEYGVNIIYREEVVDDIEPYIVVNDRSYQLKGIPSIRDVVNILLLVFETDALRLFRAHVEEEMLSGNL